MDFQSFKYTYFTQGQPDFLQQINLFSSTS